jgi:hypothetical protein
MLWHGRIIKRLARVIIVLLAYVDRLGGLPFGLKGPDWRGRAYGLLGDSVRLHLRSNGNLATRNRYPVSSLRAMPGKSALSPRQPVPKWQPASRRRTLRSAARPAIYLKFVLASQLDAIGTESRPKEPDATALKRHDLPSFASCRMPRHDSQVTQEGRWELSRSMGGSEQAAAVSVKSA